MSSDDSELQKKRSEFLFTLGKSGLIFCEYCHRDISLTLHIKCEECKNFYLCGDCFATGVKLDDHLPTHNYRVADCLEYSMFTKDWSVNEDLMLLEGIEKYGAGNWKTISEYMGTKSVKQCDEHYWEVYMGRYGCCLPVETLIPETSPSGTTTYNKVETSKYIKEFGLENKFNDKTVHSIPLKLPDKHATVQRSAEGDNYYYNLYEIPIYDNHKRGEEVLRDVPYNGVRASNIPGKKEKESPPPLPGSDLPGYMPLREDFDIEFENDAELIIADMEFSKDDHPSERELKLQVLQIYNEKLQERERRKRFVIDRNYVDFKAQQNLDRRRSKEERDLVARMKVFARFQTQEEHDAVVEGLLKARRLRKQIQLYQHYRKMGVRTIEQARQYETDRKKRDDEKKAQKQREDTPYLYATGRTKTTSSSSTKRGRGRGSQDDDGEIGNTSSDHSNNNDVAISKAPGAQSLSPTELKLCCALPMLPIHYLAIKDAIVREAFRNGTITREGVRRVVNFSDEHYEIVYDFFVKEMQLGDANVQPISFQASQSQTSSSSDVKGNDSSSSDKMEVEE